MSISLVSSPQIYQPMNNPIEWKFSSTNVSECDFNYIMDIYVNGTFAVRLREKPDNDGYGIFRIEKILQSYLSDYFNPNLVGYQIANDCILNYYVELRERYITNLDCKGTPILQSVSYTSQQNPALNNYLSWNGSLQYNQYPSYDYSKFILTGTFSQVLSDCPTSTHIGLEDNFTFNFIQDVSGLADQVYTMEVSTYNQTNSLISSYNINNPFYSIATQSQICLSVGVGPKNINDYLTSSTPISTSVKYYTIRMLDSGGGILSKKKQFKIDNRCTKYKQYRLWFKNWLGGFDSFNFNLKSQRVVNISRTTYDKLLPTDYSIGDRGTTVLNTNAQSTYTFVSNYMTENEALWMEQLFTSKEIYAIDNTPIKMNVEIFGANYNAGLADLVLDPSIILPNETTFDYVVTNGSAIGMSNSGVGVITGYDIVSGKHHTNIIATINAGALIEGSMRATIPNSITIPLVINNDPYRELRKDTVRNISYTINASTSYKINV